MNQILIGKGKKPVHLLARYGNRHGLVAGATGTGKTVSLLVLAEGFSRMGVPVFMADVKGDVAGLAMAGTVNDKILKRAAQIGMEGYANEASPVIFWDIFGELGHPVRATVSEMGPRLLARILGLNETQAGILDIVFTLADARGLLLLDLADLRAMLGFVADNRKEISAQYGLVSSPSLAAIQRALLSLEREGGERLFGEPALELGDLLRTDLGGRGIIHILAADKLVLKPQLYSSFLLWLLSELFENLPEVGDLDKPRLVFFFDEAHLLFDDAPPMLRQRVEQVVRIIRSKGGAHAGGACPHLPTALPHGGLDPRGAHRGAGPQPAGGQVRIPGEPRVRLRDVESAGPGAGHGGAGRRPQGGPGAKREPRRPGRPALGHRAAPGDGGNHGQADGPHRGQPDRPADHPGAAGGDFRRIAPVKRDGAAGKIRHSGGAGGEGSHPLVTDTLICQEIPHCARDDSQTP